MRRSARPLLLLLALLGALLGACGQATEEKGPALPDRDAARVRMARALLDQGHVFEALEQLRRLPAEGANQISPVAQPEWFEPVLRQLILRRALVQADSMLAFTGPVADRSPSLKGLSANLMVLAGDLEGAISTWSSIRTEDPEMEVQVHHELGTLFMMTGRAEEAAVQAREGLSLDPEAWQLRILLAEALHSLGRNEEALVEVQKLRPATPRWQVEARIRQYGMGDPAEAVRLLVQAHNAAPRNPDVRLQLARAHLAAGQYLEARVLLEPLVNLPVPFTGAREALIEAYLATGEEEAAGRLRDELDRESEVSDARDRRIAGLQASMGGDLALALTEFDAAIAIDPANADLYNDRGAVLARLQRYEEAEAAFRKAEELSPDDPVVQENLARLYQRTGEEALRDAAVARWQELTGGEVSGQD